MIRRAAAINALIASGRLGLGSGRAAIQASSSAIISGCKRRWIDSPFPVAGGPRRFCGSTVSCVILNRVVPRFRTDGKVEAPDRP